MRPFVSKLALITAIAAPMLSGSTALAKGKKAASSAIQVAADGKHPTVAADAKGGLHAAYEAVAADGASPDIWYVSSADGKTWSKPVDVSSSPGLSMDPAISAGKDGSVAVVWTDTSLTDMHPDIWLARSADGGKTWGKPVDVSGTPGTSSAPDVKIAPDGTIYVIWLDTSAGQDKPDVWGTASHDAGATWDKPQNISNTPGESMTPSIAVGADSAANVIWTDTTSGETNPDVFFARSSDGGKTWSNSIDLSNTPSASAECDIAVDADGNIYVDWTDTSAGAKTADVFVSASADAGKTWSKPVDASNTPGVSSDPAIAASGSGNVAVVWVDTSGGAASPDVFIAISKDAGKTFGKPQNISNTPGVSKEPDATIADGKLIAVWQEEESGKAKVKVVATPLP